jgi:mono/diheme cytochrome c family protein
MATTSQPNRFVNGRYRRMPALRIAGIVAVGLLGLAAARHGAPLAAQRAEPTFAEDVAPIFYRNCTTCHRPDGLGPFSLIDYEDAKANAGEIGDAIAAGYMPPWHAEGPHGIFRNDRRLSTADKDTILKWIEAGTPPGDLTRRPPAPVYPSRWEIGTPDAVVTMAEDFVVPASGTIEYQYFEVPTNFTEDKWVQALEILPGARAVVHHVIVYARVPPGATTTPAAPAAPAGASAPPVFARKPQYAIPSAPPRRDTRHPPPRPLGSIIGTTAPGTNVMEFPAGTALRVRAGTVLTFQMHYTAHGHETADRTSVGFRFAKDVPREEILVSAFYNGALRLPAGAKDVAVPAELEANQPVRIWGLLPHTHLRGTRWQYKLEKPDGASSVILDVPRYDFNWQTYYLFATPLEMPAGSRILSTAWYDNSASNRNNPDAAKDVTWGDQTWEEMQYTGFLYSVPGRPIEPAAR